MGEAIPTASEASFLASLTTLSPRDPPKGLTVLDEIVRMCQVDDIENFLFTEDPIQLHCLSNPNVSSTAVLSTVTSSRVEAKKNILESISYHIHGSLMFVPSFFANGLQFGFSIHNHAYHPAAVWHSPKPDISNTLESRFVKDNSRGVFLNVMDFRDVNILRFETVHTVSSTWTIRSHARVNRAAFLNSLNTRKMCMQDLLSSLLQLVSVSEYRKCPVCGRNHGGCECTPPSVKMQHPFDQAGFSNSLGCLFGSFYGVAKVTDFDYGMQKQHKILGSRLHFGTCVNMELIKVLQTWVIRKHAQRENPREYIASYSLQNSFNQNSTEHSAVDDVLDTVILGIGLNENNPMGRKESNQRAIQHHELHMSVMSEEVRHSSDEDLERATSKQIDIGNELARICYEKESIGKFSWNPHSDMMSQTCQVREFPSTRIRTKISNDDNHLKQQQHWFNMPEAKSRRATSCFKEGETKNGKGETGKSMLQYELLSDFEPLCSEDVSIFPKTQAKGSPGSIEHDLTRLVKEKIRKEQNRRSAHICNMRKKKRNEDLKKALSEGKERLEILRLREVQLRKDNLELRKILFAPRAGAVKGRPVGLTL